MVLGFRKIFLARNSKNYCFESTGFIESFGVWNYELILEKLVSNVTFEMLQVYFCRVLIFVHLTQN